jgi:hypothetical protein
VQTRLNAIRPSRNGSSGALQSVRPLFDTIQGAANTAPQAEYRGEAAKPSGYIVYEGGKMAPHDDLVDAKIAAAEAHTDTKVVRLEGKVDLVLSRLDGMSAKFDALRDDNRSARANQWVIGFGLAVLIVAVAALFPVFFSIGTQVRDLVHSEIQSQLPSNH